VTEQQRFIDCLRDALGLAPLYRSDLPRPERFWVVAPFYDGCRQLAGKGDTSNAVKAKQRSVSLGAP
jgi:hypothetical protein